VNKSGGLVVSLTRNDLSGKLGDKNNGRDEQAEYTGRIKEIRISTANGQGRNTPEFDEIN
jgi:hypothetical protein